MLDPDWVIENASEFDLFHVQFGFDAVAPATLERLARQLRAAGKPFVYTAHDLRNPHHPDSGEHDAQLEVIMAEADAIITLTRGAADEILSRWGRRALVIPHPHVVDFPSMQRLQSMRPPRETGAPFRVGIHVKSLRANMNPIPIIRALAETRHEHPDVLIQVDGHPDVLNPGGARYDAELSSLVKDYDRRGIIDLRVHDFFTDDELWLYLDSLDASVLPYRFGTHSGWLEACRDLGTDVLAPTCGYYADQGSVRPYRNDDSGFDADSLVDAVAESSRSPRREPLPVEFRVSQRHEIATAHESLYAELLA
jgi:glycosyltransferase involved in cell wall biosynthesis